ncbi:hypothetical protein ACQYWQ_02735 [Streptomyces sp. P6-2-1]|uniref:hypothetical protein n=1 Tax=Streptomyces sp. P6-2-1 TaxID=3422591 RepID=UPI003D36D059
MRSLSAAADPTGLDRALASPCDGPVPPFAPGKIREEADARRFRPEWVRLAEAEEARVLARALWWGRPGSERPTALDCLQVLPSVAAPAAVAADLPAAGHAVFGTRARYHVSLPTGWEGDPVLRAAVDLRRTAGARAGPSREIQRLRDKWTPRRECRGERSAAVRGRHGRGVP